MTTQDIRIRISADGAPQAGAAFTKAGADLRKVGEASKFTSHQMAQVNMQLTDIAVSLGSGQSPFTVLLQQGGQLKDMTGGVSPALRALGSGVMAMVSPFTLGAAAIGALAYGAYQGAEESAALRRSLLLTGNAAGVTAEGLDITSRSVAEHANTTIGAAREITAGLVATGQIGGSALGSLSQAAALVAKATGQTSEETVKDFAGMANGVAEWAAQHNKSWHFVSAAQLEHIRTLEEAGDKTGAMIEVGNALNDHLARQQENLGYVETAWYGAAKAASWFKDVILDIGRDDTMLDKLGEAQRKLNQIRDGSLGTGYLSQWLQGSEAEAQARVDTANRDVLRHQEVALAAGASAEEQARLIELRKQLAALTGRLSGETSRYQQELRLLQQAEKAGLVTAEQRVALARTLAEKEGASVKTAAERAARAKKEAAEKAEREYQEMVKSTIANRAPRLADIEAEGFAAATAAAERNTVAQADLLRRRNEQAEALGLQLIDDTAQINVSLIEDDRERGLAQIELERQAMQGRLDVLAAGGADITAAQEALNANVLAKQKALNAGMKSEWDSLHRHAEDVFASLMSGDQIDVKGIFKAIMAEQARETYRKDLAPMVEKGGKALLDFFGLGDLGKKGGGTSGSAADDWATEFGKLIGITDRQAESTEASARAAKQFGGALDSLGGLFSETTSAVAQWLATLLSSSAGGGNSYGWLGAIAGLFGGSGSGSGITSGNTGLVDYGLGGGRARGGSVAAGWDYIVGEGGVPERLRMYRGGGGHVTPMPGHSAAGGGGQATQTHNHYYQAGVSPAQMHAYGEALAARLRGETLESAYRSGRPLNRAARSY